MQEVGLAMCHPESHCPKEIPEEARKRLEALDSKPHIPLKFQYANGTQYSFGDVQGRFHLGYKAIALNEDDALRGMVLALRTLAAELEAKGFSYQTVVDFSQKTVSEGQ
jgi:hypothetical protein